MTVKSFDYSAQSTISYGFYISLDGLKLYVGDINDTIYQYTLATAFDISTASYDTKNFDHSAQSTTGTAIFMNKDGLKLYVLDGGGTLYQYTLATAFDISTASYDTVSFDTSSQNIPSDIYFSNDGTKMYTFGTYSSTNRRISQYTLSTAWDISTATYDTKYFDINTQDAGLTLSFCHK